MTIVLAFAVICTGIFILQMSKVDPRKLDFVRAFLTSEPTDYLTHT